MKNQPHSPNSKKAAWLRCWEGSPSLPVLLDRLRQWAISTDGTKTVEKKQSVRLSHVDGPMYYLAQQIVKRMGKAGYPSKIYEHFRTPERQWELFNKGRSKAGPWQSPHQFGEACDIAHKSLAWNAPPEYWETLAKVVRVVASEYNVNLVHGHHWKFVDSAHVELADWRLVRAAQGDEPRRPTTEEMAARFKEVLPRVK